MTVLFVGHDWAEAHHDVHVMDRDGGKIAAARLPEGVEGVERFHALIADTGVAVGEVTIATETDRGLFVAALVAAGYRVLAVNPASVARYRERLSMSGAKSDPADAQTLADLARLDGHHHRPIAGDSPEAEALKVLARAHQSLVWARQREANHLRSALREYYPAALEVFGTDLASPDALAALMLAPTPATARTLNVGRLETALRRAGRVRQVDLRARRIRDGLRGEHLEAPGPLAEAMGAQTKAIVAVLAAITSQIDALGTQLADRFEAHPDAEIVHSLPGLGTITGARVLAEFGDDPNRYADAKSRKNYAGSSPVTRASGTKKIVLARHVRNRHLADACYWWAFCSLQSSPGARAFYDHRRAVGDTHHAALRALSNRLVGILHGCLHTRTTYDETTAWAHRAHTNQNIAA